MKQLDITSLYKDQIREVIAARRSLPIPATVHAGMVARTEILKLDNGYKLLNKATNDATQACRDTGITEASSLITFQVCSEEYVMAEATKEVIEQEDYDVLTYPFRSVLDPASVPEDLSRRVHHHKPPEETIPMPNKPAPKPTAASRGRKVAQTRPSGAAGRERTVVPPSKPKKTAPKPVKKVRAPYKRRQVNALQDFLDGKD